MTTVIKNATIVTGDAGRTVLHNAAIVIREARIISIGTSAEVAGAYPDAEQVDASGHAVFPGLVNCHTHLLATADRGILEDFGFPTTLRFPVGARSLLSTEERQVMATLGVLEAMRSGTTCFLEISTGVQEYAQDLEKTGMRLVLSDNINDVVEERPRNGVYEFSPSRLDQGYSK